MQHTLNFLGFVLVILTCAVAEASAGCAHCHEAACAWKGSAPNTENLQWLNFSAIPWRRHTVCSGFSKELAIEFYLQRKIVEENLVWTQRTLTSFLIFFFIFYEKTASCSLLSYRKPAKMKLVEDVVRSRPVAGGMLKWKSCCFGVASALWK